MATKSPTIENIEEEDAINRLAEKRAKGPAPKRKPAAKKKAAKKKSTKNPPSHKATDGRGKK